MPQCVRDLHHYTGQFNSLATLHHILCTELSAGLPPNYNVGYFEGRNHLKRWLTNDQNLRVMNEKFTSGDVSVV